MRVSHVSQGRRRAIKWRMAPFYNMYCFNKRVTSVHTGILVYRNIILVTVLLCACHTVVMAQTTLAARVDSLLKVRGERAFARYDTAYIGKPVGKWSVKLCFSASGTGLVTRGKIGGEEFKSTLEAAPKNTLGASVSYRGLTVSFAINPAKLTGRNKDNEFGFSSYGNRFGFDVLYTSAKTFSGDVEHGGETYGIGQGSVSMELLQASAYYAFNGRRFSFPAAFSQSQVQKRSCGSWLVGLSAFAGRISASAETIHGTGATRLSTLNVAVGGGYAYNFVIKKKWLLHISAVPHIVAFSRNRLTVGDRRQRAPYRFPSLVNIGRIALGRNFSNSFMGFTAVVNIWQHGDHDAMELESLKWRARLFYGFRL